MVSVSVVRRGFGTQKLLQRLKKPEKLLDEGADIAYEAIMENFKAEGRSETGTGRQWPKLAPSTIKQRAKELGPAYAAHPILVRTGKMKSSVYSRVKGWKIIVGVRDFKAKFHVFGTIKMPQRNFMIIPIPDRMRISESIRRKLLADL